MPVLQVLRAGAGRTRRVVQPYAGVRSKALAVYGRVALRMRRWPVPGRDRTVPLHLREGGAPIHVRLGTSDLLVAAEIFGLDEYGPVLAADLGEVRTVLDLGANIGLSARLWQTAFPDAQIIAVEPDPAGAGLCRRNVADGVRPERVTVVEAAIGPVSGRLDLDRSGHEWMYRTAEASGAGEVEALTVPQVLASAGVEGPVDLLKCDIEGAEAELFRSCAGWISRVRWLVVEVHHPYGPDQLADDLAAGGARFSLQTVQTSDFASVVLGHQEAGPSEIAPL